MAIGTTGAAPGLYTDITRQARERKKATMPLGVFAYTVPDYRGIQMPFGLWVNGFREEFAKNTDKPTEPVVTQPAPRLI